MAIVRLVPIVPGYCFCRNNNFSRNNNKIEKICSCSTLVRSCRNNGFVSGPKKCRRSVCCARVSIGSGRYGSRSSWKLNAADARVIEKNSNNNAHNPTGLVDIPVCCYQLLGVPDQAEKDEIVKSVMHLKNSEIEEGYTMDAVVSRQNLLMDVRDKLLFEPEYAGNTREKVPPKSSLRIPWAWLPGALCLLQEVGEDKLVLDIGRTALNHADAKLYIHDLLLSMALAEVLS